MVCVQQGFLCFGDEEVYDGGVTALSGAQIVTFSVSSYNRRGKESQSLAKAQFCHEGPIDPYSLRVPPKFSPPNS